MKENEMPYIDMVALLEFVRKQLPDVPDRVAQNITIEMLNRANNYIYNVTTDQRPRAYYRY